MTNEEVTVFALANEGKSVVQVTVANATRSGYDGLDYVLTVEGVHDRDATCYYIDVSDEESPKWVLSRSSGERRVTHTDVPAVIQAAALLWAAEWAGEVCAMGWSEQGLDPIPEGTECSDWDARECGGLPAEGDVEFLEATVHKLAGRRPTDDERRAFRRSLVETLFDLLPCSEAADDGVQAEA